MKNQPAALAATLENPSLPIPLRPDSPLCRRLSRLAAREGVSPELLAASVLYFTLPNLEEDQDNRRQFGRRARWKTVARQLTPDGRSAELAPAELAPPAGADESAAPVPKAARRLKYQTFTCNGRTVRLTLVNDGDPSDKNGNTYSSRLWRTKDGQFYRGFEEVRGRDGISAATALESVFKPITSAEAAYWALQHLAYSDELTRLKVAAALGIEGDDEMW